MTIINIHVGNENFGQGLTTVTLTDKGNINIQNIRKIVIKKQITEHIILTKIEQIFKRINENDVYKLTKTRVIGIPDEAHYKLDIDGKTLEVWDGDVSTNPHLEMLILALREVVGQSTNGEVVL